MKHRQTLLGGRNPHASIDKLTWRREHSGEAMLDPLGSIPG
jgi:hypothetical protein